MTTGSKKTDQVLSTPVLPPYIGNNISGYYSEKTWSGQDWPSSFVKPQDLPLPDVEVWKWVWDPALRKKVYVLWTKSENNHKLVYTKGVKRSYDEKHSYSLVQHDARASSGVLFKINDGSNRWAKSTVFLGKRQIVAEQPSPWSSNDDLKLLGKLRSNISGSSFNAGVFLGESKKSLELITSSATRIYRAYRYARSGNFSAALQAVSAQYGKKRSLPKTVAKSWLEVQYGVIPLLQDVEEAARFVAHQFSAPLQFKVSALRNAGGREFDQKDLSRVYPDAQSHFFLVKGTPPHTSKKITAYLVERDVVPLSGLVSVESIAWEIMPYSFVADWFIPIGGFLDARALNQQIKGTYVTTTLSRLSCRGPVTDNGGQVTVDPAFCEREGSYNYYSYSRSAPTTELNPPLPVIRPLGQSVTWAHASNAVALLVNAFSSVKK